MIMTKLKKIATSKYSVAVPLLLVLLWASQLINTDAYYVCYLLVTVIACICIYTNNKSGELLLAKSYGKYEDAIITISAFSFSCMVAMANYELWGFRDLFGGSVIKSLYSLFLMFILFTGGFIAFGNIFNTVCSNTEKLQWKEADKSLNPKSVFLVSFVLLVLTRLAVLYFCQYPGVLTTDSFDQITQTFTGNYSNHHPFFHTMVIKYFVDLGLFLFKDINAAVATYSVFQILFTAVSFSFAVSTMARMKAPKWIIISSILFFLLMPYHIMYAITMWKDVMFGCFVLIFIISGYRCLNAIGNRMLNYVVLTLSCLGFCLFRSNGLFAFVIVTIVFAALWRLKEWRMLVIFISVILISLVVKHGILDKMGVKQPDTIESLSVPAQQIARVVYEGCELNEWERATLEEIVDVDRIPETYLPYISDNIKALVRQKGKQNLIVENKIDYIKLYMVLGIKYPKAYLMGWIDETRGYWDAGYGFHTWSATVTENELEIKRFTYIPLLATLLDLYLELFTNTHALKIFISIGFFIWIDIIMFMLALFRRDRTGLFVSIPVLAIVVSLIVATPVFSELRYAYATFCTIPIVIVIAQRDISGGKEIRY